MKNKLLLLLTALVLTALPMAAQQFVNLTPRPKSMTVGTGELVLPTTFGVSTAGLPADMAAEVETFVEAFNRATGYAATATADAAGALFTVAADASLAEEAYRLDVTAEGVSIKAATPAGLYFAFQTVKKILPPNVMAGVKDAKVTRYALPVVAIDDEPRFGYRGFMLDVARHFFTVDEVKRMLDVMSYYKMNRFHWHLSDDQGWRVEIKKYPKLTTVGSTAPNSRFTDMTYGQYWINRPYGPYFYTQDQLREVVAYAKARHIEIIPEIDMPGHFVAALVAYPEFSCTPYASRSVWTDGGISSDVLNVANPKAVAFAKDILAELADIFPYEYIHIGGDECPTSAWQANAACQALYEAEGMTSWHQLQSRFIKEMADFLKTKNRRIAVWNEAITADGADTELIKEAGAYVYCWQPAVAGARKAAELGLDNVYTAYGPYYINRKQSTDPGEPTGAGNGADSVRTTYNEEALPTSVPSALAPHYTGVQGTFWTEHVSDRTYMEYLALPRLIAVAEAGWTPRTAKNYDDFRRRVMADTVMLNYNGYNYGRHIMGKTAATADKMMPKASTAAAPYYYRLVTMASDANRSGRCWELVRAGSPLISQYGANGAAAGKLWTNAQAAEGAEAYDYQLWAFEEDPANEGRYALVCKAVPDGSLLPTPSATTTAGRWTYDNAAKHYDFVLGENGYGQNGANYYYSIRSTTVTDRYLNASLGGQGFAVNVYADPADGNGGLWTCVPTFEEEAQGSIPALVEGTVYRFGNSVEGFNGTAIVDDGEGQYLRHSTTSFANNAWEVTAAGEPVGNTQTVRLKNVATGRYFGAAATEAVGKVAYPVAAAASGVDVLLTYNADEEDYTLSVGGKNLYPIPFGSTLLQETVAAGSVISGGNAVRPVGAAWKATPVQIVTYVCKDEAGAELATYTMSLPLTETDLTASCPILIGYRLKTASANGQTVTGVYERTYYKVTVTARDRCGALISRSTTLINVGDRFRVEWPQPRFYTMVSATHEEGSTITPTADMAIEAVYETNAYNGVKELSQKETTVEDGHSYVIYDSSDANEGGRRGFRYAVPEENSVYCVRLPYDALPYATWTLEASGKGFKVKNTGADAYVPQMTTATKAPVLSANGDVFTFNLNSDGSWKIQGSNGVCWDGLASGALVGWNAPGHPYVVYSYYAEPYFKVALEAVDTEGKVLASSADFVKAGAAYSLEAPAIKGYLFQSMEGNEGLDEVVDNTTVRLIYGVDPSTGIGGVMTDGNTAPAAIYDLSGRRLSRVAGPGIYICNGSKVLVK